MIERILARKKHIEVLGADIDAFLALKQQLKDTEYANRVVELRLQEPIGPDRAGLDLPRGPNGRECLVNGLDLHLLDAVKQSFAPSNVPIVLIAIRVLLVHLLAFAEKRCLCHFGPPCGSKTPCFDCECDTSML
jgi:hypothetical protein